MLNISKIFIEDSFGNIIDVTQKLPIPVCYRSIFTVESMVGL